MINSLKKIIIKLKLNSELSKTNLDKSYFKEDIQQFLICSMLYSYNNNTTFKDYKNLIYLLELNQ